ncbi:Dopey, N-terminal-domain-containing protein [Sporodiniella umbellata]|nr:Dopey, N-terminal-domain-containing protein [Sporodiniella umbellata]
MSESPVTESSKSTLKCIVIDTNAIINGTSLRLLAEEFYTCPEVLAEVRSAHSKEYLERLPFELKLMNPTEESMKTVIEFSKKTGDYGVLSVPDLKVLALTHTLEKRENGDANIRLEPLVTRPSGALPNAPPPRSYIKNPAPPKIVDEDGWEVATTKKRFNKSHSNNKNKNVSELAKKLEKVSVENKKETKEETKTEVPNTSAESVPKEPKESVSEEKEETVSEENKSFDDVLEKITSSEGIPLIEDDEDDEDAGEWITPDNVDEYKAIEIGITPEELRQTQNMAVGCMTADFAMQNVLLQMNLNLVSAGGYRVKKIRNSVMRCHACFTVTNNLEKKFCPKCGNSSLQRVTCSTNSKGEIQYHLRKNFQYRLRGTKYDIPPPKGGRKTNNIVLREDQREYIKATQFKKKKNVVDMFDPDFIPLYGKTDTREVTNNMFGTDTIGYGRKNPNSSKKRLQVSKNLFTDTLGIDFIQHELSKYVFEYRMDISIKSFQNDSRFRKYVQLVEKNLQSFDAVYEWADIISFLGRLLKSFQAYPQFPVIPRKQLVAKRLAQCLNPGFPAGVHQKTLEEDQLADDLAIWSTGLFPFVQHAATHVKVCVFY